MVASDSDIRRAMGALVIRLPIISSAVSSRSVSAAGPARLAGTIGGGDGGWARPASRYQWSVSRASAMVGSNNSTGLPDGSSISTWLPPTPVTMSLRK